MIVSRALSICIFLAVLAPQTAIGQSVAIPLENVETDDEYIRAIRLQRVQTDVQYFDPNAVAPDFQTNEKPKPPETRRTRSNGASAFNLPTVLITGAILLAVVFLFFRYGGAGSLVLRSDVKNPTRSRSDQPRTAGQRPADTKSLNSILNNPDRQQALISMAQLLIYKAVTANDLLLQRSWTARDVLRRMPKNSKYLPELSALVLKGELVHFGEREVSEEEFADFAARAKPLLQELST